MTDFIFDIILSINNFINTYYIFSFIIYFIFSIVFFMFSLPGGLIILMGSGFFFGFLNGFLINITSISLGSLIFITFSNNLFKKLFNKAYNKYSKKISGYISSSSYEYLILIRLVVGPPLIFQNLCISLLDISKTKILISSVIGFSPLMFVFSYSGNHASNIIQLKEFTLSKLISFEILLVLIFLIILTLLKIFFKK
ncbi:MAG: hypothetical protein HOI06_01535 [Pelagibacteraceae bacterium]|nr:hypothetical protein [Pelagibacteraceae bacterium]MBT3902014.1 hypothetical protein [Pelagibacteraceae bacterium]MBT6197451.1 hypothetical protein [Pelagibacteraceae bacterium]